MGSIFRLFGQDIPVFPFHEHQVFEKIQEEVLIEGPLFEDETYPAHMMLLGRDEMPEEVKWMRPWEISENPKFVAVGKDGTLSKQGSLGNCWWMAGIGGLSQERLNFIVPTCNPEFSSSEYCGAYTFNFWNDGRWVSVVTDDRLPVVDGKLLYACSFDDDEFWVALLEKSYAKLMGSFDHLRGGRINEAFLSLTAGITSRVSLKSMQPDQALLKIIWLLHQKCLVGTSKTNDERTRERQLDLGIVQGHAYSLLAIFWLRPGQSEPPVPIVLLRNPWGRVEWQGKWGRSCPSWSNVSAKIKARIGLQNLKSGCFFMEFGDYLDAFDRLEVCVPEHFLPLQDQTTSAQQEQRESRTGSWTSETAGGSRRYPASYRRNPQHEFRVDGSLTQTVTISLVIMKYRHRRWLDPDKRIEIGFDVYKKDKSEPLAAAKHQKAQEVSATMSLKPGLYTVIPSTKNAAEEADYVLRIWKTPRKRIRPSVNLLANVAEFKNKYLAKKKNANDDQASTSRETVKRPHPGHPSEPEPTPGPSAAKQRRRRSM